MKKERKQDWESVKSKSYTNIRKSVIPTSERPFSDVGMYNNRFPNVSVGF